MTTLISQLTPAQETIVIAIGIIALIQVHLWLRRIGLKNIFISLAILFFVSLAFSPSLFIITGLFIIGSLVRLVLYLKKSRNGKLKSSKEKNENSLYLESNKGDIEIGNPYRGTLIMGSAGSGKSRSLFYPIIKQFISNNYAGILYDFKSPELSEFAYSFHDDTNTTKFACLNFKDVKNSVRINPLSPEYLTKQAIAFELATVLINNLLPESIKKKDYWTRSSVSVIAGSIWYLRNNYPHLCTLPHLIAMILFYPSSQLIELLSADIETAGMIASLKEAHEMKAEKQIAGVVGTIKNALAQLNIPEVFYLFSKGEVDLDLNNKSNPTFLAIGNDSTLSSTYAPVISLTIGVCTRQMNQPNKHKSAIILDEAPTLYIPDFEQIPATARSNKVAVVYGVQDYSQMIDKQGADKAQVMISNLSNQFYGRTVNEKTADMIVKLFGKHDVTYTTMSKNSGNSYGDILSSSGSSSSTGKSESQSIQQRERVKVSDIINLQAGKFYGLIAEGNIGELIGVQFKQVPDAKREFKIENKNVDLNAVFKQIYKDIELLSITKKDEAKGDLNSFGIELI